MIKPALTAEEWEFYLRVREDRAPLYPPDLPTDIAGTPHAIAAKALYGQSFGLTREDVLLLRAAAEACRNDDHYIASELDAGEWYEGRKEKLAQRYEAFAERIESLLPPEKG